MTDTPETPTAAAPVPAAGTRGSRPNRTEAGPDRTEPRSGKGGGKGGRKPARPTHSLLQTLFTLYPALFGARFLPLKLGVFEDLRTAHPDALPADELKVALGLHTRSNRYIEAVASGLPRHGLDAQPVEPVAPEHVHHAILELYRRKSTTPQEPAARQRAVAQLADAIERSGLGRDGYNERFGAAPAGRELLDEALAAIGQKAAKQEALRRAFTASGKSVEDFADMYGMPVADVKQLVETKAP